MTLNELTEKAIIDAMPFLKDVQDGNGNTVDLLTFKGSVFRNGYGVPVNQVVPVSDRTPEGLFPPLT